MSYLSSAHITEGQPPNPFGSSFACSLVYPLPLERLGPPGMLQFSGFGFLPASPEHGPHSLKAWSA
jgi:hypothetical protein